MTPKLHQICYSNIAKLNQIAPLESINGIVTLGRIANNTASFLIDLIKRELKLLRGSYSYMTHIAPLPSQLL